MQRPKASAEGAPAGGAVDHDLQESCPQVHSHLVDTTWDDGSERQTSTLLVFVEDGLWKACLHDREARATLWATGTSLLGVIGAVEGQVSTGHGSWRRDKVGSWSKGRKGS